VEPDIDEDLTYTYNADLSSEPSESSISIAQKLLTHLVGLDVDNPEEKDTPRRYVEALLELTTPQYFSFTMFDSDYTDMVIEKGIPFATLCRHHLLPFTGVCHVGYIPNGRIVGLSKIPRLVALESAKLNTQEDLTARIANSMIAHLLPLGVAVIMEAEHTCMAIRGARAIGVKTRTAAMRGVFGDHDRTAKAEFMEAIR